MSETIAVGIAMKGARAMSDSLDDAWFESCFDVKKSVRCRLPMIVECLPADCISG